MQKEHTATRKRRLFCDWRLAELFTRRYNEWSVINGTYK